jgi:phosphoribosylaminoimidazole (AIR) synthetase
MGIEVTNNSCDLLVIVTRLSTQGGQQSMERERASTSRRRQNRHVFNMGVGFVVQRPVVHEQESRLVGVALFKESIGKSRFA